MRHLLHSKIFFITLQNCSFCKFLTWFTFLYFLNHPPLSERLISCSIKPFYCNIESINYMCNHMRNAYLANNIYEIYTVLYYHYEIFIHGYNPSAISSGYYLCGRFQVTLITVIPTSSSGTLLLMTVFVINIIEVLQYFVDMSFF